MASCQNITWDSVYTLQSDLGDFADSKLSPKFKRSKSGCFTCRFRRKKCQEQRPVCEGCRRNNLICSWPGELKSKIRAPKSSARGKTIGDDHATDILPPKLTSDCPLRTLHPDVLSIPKTNTINMTITMLPALRNDGIGRRLLHHYTNATALHLTVLVSSTRRNPFLNLVLPIIHQDSDILHVVLALGGSHLSFSNPSYSLPAQEHYAVALRAVKHRITQFHNVKKERDLPLLLLLILLCQFESVDGNMSGAILYHLNAAKTLLLEMQDSFHSVDEDLMGFVLEQYFYFESVARNVGIDLKSTMHEADSSGLLRNETSMTLLSGSATFGFMFGHSFDLFQLIPDVAELAHRQPTNPDMPRHTDPEIFNDFIRLERTILEWEPSPSPSTDSSREEYPPDSTTAGLLHQQALLIFLRAALNGPGYPVPHVAQQIDIILSEFVASIRALTEDSLAWTNLLWTVLIAGSCLKNVEDRQCFHDTLTNLGHRMNTSLRVLQVSHWIWESSETDPEAYGPHGITKVCNKRGVKISIG